jgi:dipeptidyl aminopeptidase/acylaminoacyl peptidase
VPAVTGPRLQQIAIFDRQGKKVQNVGAPGLYGQILSMSPDGKRVAAIHTDQNTSQADVWVIEIATGKGTAITADADDNSVPVWSPDGNQVAYVTTIDKVSHIFRRAANGTGQAELLYKHSGPGLVAITDWSGDELVFWSGKVMYALAVAGDRKPIALSDGKFNVKEGRISPDGRFIAYNSDQGGRSQVYVSKRGSTVGVPLVDETAIGGIFWPSGGKELYYLTTQGQQVLHTVDLRVEGDTVTAGASRELFRLPSPLLPVAQMSSFATPDGQRFVFLVPADTP